MTAQEYRESFLHFFERKGHKIYPSFPLIPAGDPSLLFTSAGMVPFKPYFLGKIKFESPRAVSCQKCFRTTDIEEVGKTPRHHTFFEMLGNFSFGDYFKQEAIEMAWEYVTQELKIPEEKLWVSVYLEDDEASLIWEKNTGVPRKKIIRLGMSENYWPAPPALDSWLGPCGPCSEIFVDHGPQMGCSRKDCAPGCECNRFEELWNLVFQQYQRDGGGNLSPLPRPGIDTGMGLERLLAIMQGKPTNYETDLFYPIIEELMGLIEFTYGNEPEKDISMRIIADHARAVGFLISDGVTPSNEGRGYALRRIIRRAIRHGKLLQIEKPFLYRLMGVVAAIMREPYAELHERREYISRVVFNEEKRFQQTLNQGINLLNDLITQLQKTNVRTVSGDELFRLYDTYGFPLELTQEIAVEKGLAVDTEGFYQEMEKQRERARLAWQGSGETELSSAYGQLESELESTKFVGYSNLKIKTRILALIKDGQIQPGLAKEDSSQDKNPVEVVLESTPFYGEAGGQLGDTGFITGKYGQLEVMDTKRLLSNLIIHQAYLIKGSITVGEEVEAEVDSRRRQAIARHHTATHLLHTALRKILGSHVQQSGSMVCPDRLRFDFTHFTAPSPSELMRVEDLLNQKIWENLPVIVEDVPLEEAKQKGAMALFGEKYGEIVRMVTIGEFSRELCGGNHVRATGEIGLAKVISESSIAAGLRRIEMVVGESAYRWVSQKESILEEVTQLLKTSPAELVNQIKKLQENLRQQEKKIASLRVKLALSQVESLLSQVQEVTGVKVLAARVEGLDMESLRKIADELRARLGSGVIVLGTPGDGRVDLITVVTKNLTSRLHAGEIARAVATIVGGSGGGRPDLGQAGGKYPEKLDEALRKVAQLIPTQENNIA